MQNDPPQFQDQNSVYNISEESQDGDIVGTVVVSDDMGMLRHKSMLTRNYVVTFHRRCDSGDGKSNNRPWFTSH